MAAGLTIRRECWPITGGFTISRASKTSAAVVVVELTDRTQGRGECVPYARYGESVPAVIAAIERMRDRLAAGLDRTELQHLMAPGAARNALDCAFWDLEAKRAARPVHELAGLPPPRPVVTAYTISLGPPSMMAEAAAAAAWRPVLKIKLGADGTKDRIRAVRAAAPSAELVVDANEAWTPENLLENFAACAEAGVALIEQPLPAAADHALASTPRLVPVCADESVHDRLSLARLGSRYDAINIKLDKAGGLTEAMALLQEAERRNLTVMVGCMVATSLAIAPAVLLAQRARFIDLDGPLLLAHDRCDGLHFDGGLVHPPTPQLWG